MLCFALLSALLVATALEPTPAGDPLSPIALSSPAGTDDPRARPTPTVDAADEDTSGVEVDGSRDDEDTAPAVSGAMALYAEAQRELAVARHTAYAHTTGVDEAAGRFVFDCSGFVGYALRNAVPDAFAELQAATSVRPTSRDFVRFVQSLEARTTPSRWRRVSRVDELQPGDIVAWLRPQGSRARVTGHVMIVAAAPYEYPEGSGEYVLRIIDSSGSRRAPLGNTGTARRMTGLGVGRVVLVSGSDGAPVGFRWVAGGRARTYRSPVALAHLE